MKGGYESLKMRLIDILGAKNVIADAPMKYHTSFRAGGLADLLITPKSTEELLSSMRALNDGGAPFYVMGNGTNLLVRDSGFKGVIIKLCDGFSHVDISGLELTAKAGALISSVSKIAYDNGLAGLEFAEGIPGTVGGAVAMNAGAYGGEMKNVIASVCAASYDGKTFEIKADGLEMGYRSSAIGKNGLICLSATFRLYRNDKSEIKKKMDENRRQRTEKQPLDKPSAGSTFKRPEGYFAGKLISDAGLKGYRIGGASVSEKHAGFVINDGNATSEDILRLIGHIQDTVLEKFGVKLEPEVKIIGG